MQNSNFWTGITSLCVSQTSPVVSCMHYSVISTRMTCLYISQPFPLVFTCKTATFGAELQVPMGPRPHLSFLAAKQRLFEQNNKSLWVPDLNCRLCMQYIVISIRITCLYLSPPWSVFWLQSSVFWYRIISLYGPQTSPVVLCMQNSVISIRITSLYGSQPSSVVYGCKTATFGPE